MSLTAQRAQADFARMAGEVGGAIRIEDLLLNGFDSLPASLQRRFPSLSSWRGLGQLKESLRRIAGFDSRLLLAARSAELMKFAAILLCRPCENILVTDLGWPPYHRILDAVSRAAGRRVTSVLLAHDVIGRQLTAEEVADKVSSEFIQHGCDGLFVTSVNNYGVRLPVGQIIRAIGNRCRFAVVDGAQDFCHVGEDAPADCCDLYLAGCHKWLGGYHPLGIAMFGRRRSRGIIESVLDRLLKLGKLSDPLLNFVQRIEGEKNCDPGETVNLTALFASAGAASDAAMNSEQEAQLAIRRKNGDAAAKTASHAGWKPCRPDKSLESGILLVKATTDRAMKLEPDQCRAEFQQHGVALTAYDEGLLRLSMPAHPITTSDLDLLRTSLISVAAGL
jgi:hypothetical protein